MNIKILSAAHKIYPMPEDGMYIPVQVNSAANGHFEGTAGSGFAHDDDGDNISLKNPYYCELTALYWGWKNVDCDYLGLVHYRRYMQGRSSDNGFICKDPSHSADFQKKWKKILSGGEAQKLIKELENKNIYVILPQKRHYVIETLYSHYAHSHHEADLAVTAQVIRDCYPDYRDTFTDVMKRRSSHMFNMCIMRKDILDSYCEWLFDVLGHVEERLDISAYTDFDKRVFGRISELLLDVWLTENNIAYFELPLINLEGENWPRKILRFIRRKFIPEHR